MMVTYEQVHQQLAEIKRLVIEEAYENAKKQTALQAEVDALARQRDDLLAELTNIVDYAVYNDGLYQIPPARIDRAQRVLGQIEAAATGQGEVG